MDFVVVCLVFALFLAGMVFAIQGFVGKEIYPAGRPFGITLESQRPAIDHPPERHRARLMLIGAGLMVLSVVLGLVLI